MAQCEVVKGVGIIPDDVTFISGRKGFKSCEELIEVTIPNNITSISYGAFSGCINL